MKLINYITVFAVTILSFTACTEGIDPISKVDPGPDSSNPVVTMSFPSEGAAIQVKEDVTSVQIKGTVTDDIELKSVSVKIDGTQITSYSTFKDYRRFLLDYTYNNVTNGNHKLEIVATDLSGKTTTQAINFVKKEPYKPIYGEIFYMPFDASSAELVSITNATVVGNPTFKTGKKGQAYAGATDSYLSFPAATLKSSQFSAIFWIKVNSNPDRAGILVLSPNGTDNRTQGFRLFREGSTATQTLKLNVGTGMGEEWIDICQVAANDSWKQIAFSVSTTAINVFVDGALVVTRTPAKISWNDACTILSIGSGVPNFSYWDHKADLSLIDELRIFSKALTAAEVQTIYNAEK